MPDETNEPKSDALAGIRVIDFTAAMAGPYCTRYLADLGADVIKIEEPTRGDLFRVFRDDLYGPHFRAHNRGKRSLALNLHSPASRDIVDRMVSEADVLIENYRPGMAEALGIGAERAKNTNDPRCAVFEEHDVEHHNSRRGAGARRTHAHHPHRLRRRDARPDERHHVVGDLRVD